jgi:hypothetical protein
LLLRVTFSMKNWSKIYLSDKVSDRQMAAVEALPLKHTRSGSVWLCNLSDMPDALLHTAGRG